MTHPDQPSSPDWIQAAVDRFEGSLVRYAQRLTGDLESARDVVQEVFLRLCRERPSDVEDHLAQWLYTVCRRRALDVAKKETRMKASTNGLPQDPPARHPGQESLLEQQEMASQLSHLLDQLPATQQEVLRLKFQAGLSYREISNVTELSVSNVGYLIHTAIQTLRRRLAEASS